MTKPWLRHKDTIHDLYKVKGKTLEETMKIMKLQYGFKASTRAYRAKFKLWGWTKYNKQHRSASVASPSPHEAQLMTPGLSSEGESRTSGPAMSGAVSGLHSRYAFRSPEMGQSAVRSGQPRGDDSLLSPALSPPMYSQQTFHQPMQQMIGNSPVRGLQRATHHSQGPFPCLGPGEHEQQPSSYRAILPAHHHHQGLHVETGTAHSSAYHAILSPALSGGASPVQTGRLNDNSTFPTNSGPYLTPFERYLQTFVSWTSTRAHVSPEELHDFCSQCAAFVQGAADDLGRLVPGDLARTLRAALVSPEPVSRIQAAVMDHQRQLQRAQQDLGFVVPPWVSVWILACQQRLDGNAAALDDALDALSYLFLNSSSNNNNNNSSSSSNNSFINIHSLRDLLFRQITTSSSNQQQPEYGVWSQQQ